MTSIILYNSRYGTTAKYARELGQLTGLPVMADPASPVLLAFDRIIYMGGLYAGDVTGLRDFSYSLPKAKKLAVITVGIADVHNGQTMAGIEDKVRKQIPSHFREDLPIYHLPGAIRYKKLSTLHRFMMGMLVLGLKCKSPSKRPADAQAIIDTYGKKLDLVNFDELQPIAEALRP